MVERAMQTTKNQAQKAKSDDEWHKDDSRTFGRLQKLSALQPSVLGVSLCSTKLVASQTGNTVHDDQVEV